jgi:hypothetical protein
MSETVEYPKGFKVRSLPDDLSLSNGDFNLSRKCTTKGQSITVKQSLRLDVLDIPLSRYSNLLEMVNRFDALDRGKLVLTIES